MDSWDRPIPDGCPACGALPCDWVQNPTRHHCETVDAVVDAILRIMPNADGYEAKSFVASLYEEIYSSGLLDAQKCVRCDDTGTKDHAGFAMDPCDNPDCKFGAAYSTSRLVEHRPNNIAQPGTPSHDR